MLISGKHPHKKVFSGNQSMGFCLLQYELAFPINISILRILRGPAVRNVFSLHLPFYHFSLRIYDYLAELFCLVDSCFLTILFLSVLHIVLCIRIPRWLLYVMHFPHPEADKSQITFWWYFLPADSVRTWPRPSGSKGNKLFNYHQKELTEKLGLLGATISERREEGE